MEDKPVVSTAGGLTISEETKKTMTDLQDSAKALSSPKETVTPIESNDPVELLGGIYDLMLKQRILELERRKHEVELKLKDKKERDEFNKLLIDSLKEEPEKKATKVPKKKKKKPKPTKATAGGALEAGMGAAVMTAAVQDKGREEEKTGVVPVSPSPTPVPEQEKQTTPTPTPPASANPSNC